MTLTPAVSKLLKASCPTATQDVRANLENRAIAIRDAKYGPLNPQEPNDAYWSEIASEWGVSPEEAKKQRCGNCAAFIQTSEMLQCIEGGLAQGDTRETAWDVTEAGELGLWVVPLQIETEDALSSGKYKTKHPFNPIQIKDGFIVRLSKDGRIKEKIDTYPPTNKKAK
jgi:hypothetical protein